jgi:hypothetical protein
VLAALGGVQLAMGASALLLWIGGALGVTAM